MHTNTSVRLYTDTHRQRGRHTLFYSVASSLNRHQHICCKWTRPLHTADWTNWNNRPNKWKPAPPTHTQTIRHYTCSGKTKPNDNTDSNFNSPIQHDPALQRPCFPMLLTLSKVTGSGQKHWHGPWKSVFRGGGNWHRLPTKTPTMLFFLLKIS